MPRRTAERIGGPLSSGQHIRACDGGLRRPIGGLPCARPDGTGGIGLMIACLADGGFGVIVAATGGVNIGDHLCARAVDMLPPRIDVAQKGNILWRMERRDRAKARVLRRDEITACRRSAFGQPGDTLGLFGARLDHPVGHEMFGIVLPLPRVKNRLHLSSPINLRIAAWGRRICVTLSCASNPSRS